jgi:hypothetical protein
MLDYDWPQQDLQNMVSNTPGVIIHRTPRKEVTK